MPLGTVAEIMDRAVRCNSVYLLRHTPDYDIVSSTCSRPVCPGTLQMITFTSSTDWAEVRATRLPIYSDLILLDKLLFVAMNINLRALKEYSFTMRTSSTSIRGSHPTEIKYVDAVSALSSFRGYHRHIADLQKVKPLREVRPD